MYLGVPPLALRASRGRVLRGFSACRPSVGFAPRAFGARPYTRSRLRPSGAYRQLRWL
jgi:hypothetical protein